MRSILFLCLSIVFAQSCSQDRNFGLKDDQQAFGQSVLRNGKVDVLWVVDTSSSMEQHQQQLSEQVGPLLDFLRDKKRGIDFHMASITMDTGYGGDGGRFIGNTDFITRSTPNLEQEFYNRVVLGAGGSSVERAFESVRYLFEGEGQPGFSDFLREDAPLIIIFLTNEDDQSGGEVSNLASFLDGLKPLRENGKRGWIAHLMGVLEGDGECTTRYNYAEPSYRMLELSQASGGRQGTICSADLRTIAADIRAEIVKQLTDFRLDRAPQVDTIQVEVERYEEVSWGELSYRGKEVVTQSESNGWVYLPQEQVIRFTGEAVPGEFDRILVKFTPRTSK